MGLTTKIKVGIVGGAGYTAGELIRILLYHSRIEITSIVSTSNAGNPIYLVHDDLVGETDLCFQETLNGYEDVVFLCLGHGNSAEYLSKTNINVSTKIIDLSNDFRLNSNATLGDRHFVYGLPELNKEKIINAQNIANPGCFATAIQLALLPLAKENKLTQDVHISAITGSTGAGRGLADTGQFSWRNNNVSVYKAFTHQHLGEIGESLTQLQTTFENEIHFIPYRGNFARGIFASVYTPTDLSLEEANKLYKEYYKDAAFTVVSDREIHLKQVVNTNKCYLHLQKQGKQLLITSVIDNLVKGASGQAVQNMNLLFNYDEKEGLNLKANLF